MTARHSSDWSASDIARYDQEITLVGHQVSALVEVLRQQAAEHGERQGEANVIAFMLQDMDRDSMAGLLMVALRQLAGFGAA